MNNIFHEYMSKRLDEVNLSQFKTKPGPVVTISRMAGCSSQRLARELAKELNKIEKTNTWSVISKEVLHESAQRLKLNPKKIKTIFKIKDRSVFDDIVQAFLSKDYHLERKMRNTVINVIHRFAIEGHKIILGRASNTICNDIKDALHVRIEAPIEWRINRIMQSKNLSKEETESCLLSTEKDRINFRKSIKGKDVNNNDFDLTINQSKFTSHEIIEIIITTLKFKYII